MKNSKLNEAWHELHKMPANAPLEQRIKWHLEHQKQCRCRPIPAKLMHAMRERGLL